MSGEGPSEKKRLSETEDKLQSPEEESKRSKLPDDDERDDCIFYEDDTDTDLDESFEEGPAECGHKDTYVAPMVDEEKQDGKRRCLQVDLCNIFQHEAAFKGLPLFELFKVKLKFNDKRRVANEPFKDARVCGEIVNFVQAHSTIAIPDYHLDLDNPIPISYYSVSPSEPDFVNLDSDNKYTLLPLSGPNPRPPLQKNYSLMIDFALKINDEIMMKDGEEHRNPQLFGNNESVNAGLLVQSINRKLHVRGKGPVIVRDVMGNRLNGRILIATHCAVYEGAWANIKLKVLKEGVRFFHGFVMARPCVFYSRICLLSIQPENKIRLQRVERGFVGPNGSIELTRSVVVVPSYASLIIGAALYDCEKGGEVICRGRTCFYARAFGEETQLISYNGVETLQVTVNWKWEEPSEKKRLSETVDELPSPEEEEEPKRSKLPDDDERDDSIFFEDDTDSDLENDFDEGLAHSTIPIPDYNLDLDNPIPISYYSVSHSEPDFVNLDYDNKYTLLPLAGPNPRPLIHSNHTLSIDFALKIDDEIVMNDGAEHRNPQLFGNNKSVKAGVLIQSVNVVLNDRGKGPFIIRDVMGNTAYDRILVSSHSTVYDGAWATIKLRVLKEGVRFFHGFIMARPCVFYSRICLLSIQPGNKIRLQRGEKGVVGPDGSIELTRSVVVVPSYASLIIGAALYDCERGGEVICRERQEKKPSSFPIMALKPFKLPLIGNVKFESWELVSGGLIVLLV
ncbi:mediator complex, partial [Striga asiatica]